MVAALRRWKRLFWCRRDWHAHSALCYITDQGVYLRCGLCGDIALYPWKDS